MRIKPVYIGYCKTNTGYIGYCKNNTGYKGYCKNNTSYMRYCKENNLHNKVGSISVIIWSPEPMHNRHKCH